ncbi:BTAD domain-containing putative transcriptional regulator [Nocardioides sp. LS1]|uniref:nSTAND1 domain-containing NTPase n=1 Tax=Nocardioides sp. LS1 TaxID=1027620 RepID=UPI000F627DA5|nr:BTAD domain-containing putative transcriptional regulator [Nocardioides sp. LS1]GCD92303.1 hypothetical protein NLS1_43090 [Nocardioides sp. LS1]
MGITVLGPLTVDGQPRLSPRDRVVLAALATGGDRPVTADQLKDALWGDTVPPSGTKILQGCIVRLRKALGPDAIQTSPGGYLLRLSADDVDARRFEVLVERGRELLTLGEADRAAYVLGEALALWRGDPFTDVEGWDPATAEAARLGELLLEAEELRVDALMRAGRHREVLAECQSLVRAAPLRERRWALLAYGQYLAGRQGEALRTIHQVKVLLAEQLGIDPSPDLAALEQAILRQDASLLVDDALPAGDEACPYQGLMAYDVGDADSFFGRDDDVAACLDVLRRTSTVALVGPSGCGKSSLLRAGIGAALRRQGQTVVVLTPREHPMQALTAVTAAGGRRPVLLVDQCEEVFTLCADPAERHEFLAALVHEATTGTVAIALRADRLADVASHPSFGRLVERGLHLLGGLDDDGLRAAIEGPARQAGLLLEPGLVDLLVREVRDDPGALPLLAHALLETWKRREGHTLTVAGYQSTGGIHGAVAQSAERLYAQVGAGRRHLLRDLVLRLVAAGSEGEPVRSRVPRRQVATDDEHERLIEMLVAARLVTSDDGILEITHEALARAWPRLRAWLDDDVDGQRILHHLTAAADAWDSLGRPDSELYRGVRLARAVEWQARSRSTLTATEEEFLDAGRRVAELEEQSAAERARVQARLIHRLRGVLTGAVVVTVLAVVAGMLAVQQKRSADESSVAATDAETTAVARRAGAAALVSDDIDESLLLALSGVALHDSPDTRSSLLAAMGRNPRLIASTPLREGDQILEVATSPDGRSVATLDEARLVRLYDAGTGAFVAEHQAGVPRIEWSRKWGRRLLAFSPDSTLLAVGATANVGPAAELLDARTLAPTDRLRGLPDRGWEVRDLGFSADGSRLAVALQRSRVEGTGLVPVATRAMVWDVASSRPPITVRVPAVDGPSVALSDDGGTLWTSDPLTRHDLRTGAATVVDHGGSPLTSLTVTRDPDVLAGIRDWGAELVDTRTGRTLSTLPSSGTLVDLRISPDRRSLLGICWGDRIVTEWDIAHDRPSVQAEFTLDRGNGGSVDFAADGSYLFAAAAGGELLRQWDLAGHRQYLPVVDLPTPAPSGWGVLAPGGRWSTVLTGDAWSFRDYVTGATSEIPMQPGYRHTVGAWHPDGEHYATATGKDLIVWDIASGHRARSTRVSSGKVTEIAFSPDGSRLAVAELSGRVSLLDGETLAPVGRPIEVGESVSWVAMRPDDRTAVVLIGGPGPNVFWSQQNTRWALLDLESGSVVREGPLGLRYSFWLAVSPDGRYAAVTGGTGSEEAGPTGAAGQVLVLDLESGRPVRPPGPGHGGIPGQASFSPDSTQLLTSSFDGSVTLWDVRTVSPLASVAVEGRPYLASAFLPDGGSARILDPSTGSAWTWDLDPQHAVDAACRMAGRQLSAEEWRASFGDRPYVSACPAT